MEDHEKKVGEVDIEQSLERLDSSEEALDLEEGVAAFTDKWSGDPDLKDYIVSIAEKKNESETKAVLQALIAMGGAGAAMFGIHDDLSQYMDANTFYLADEITARIAGVSTMLMAAHASWNNFKDSFKKGEKINRLRNQEA